MRRIDNTGNHTSASLLATWLGLMLLLLCTLSPAFAQEHVLHTSVTAGGGGQVSGGAHILQATLGQPFAGRTAGADQVLQAGFWTHLSPFLLAAPALSSPIDGAADVPRSTTLTWGAIQGAASYHVQLSKTDDFLESSLVEDSTGIDGTSLDVTGLEGTTTYFWRVRATSIGIFSQPYTFTTVVGVGIDGEGIPDRMDLKQNYPNPFNPQTTIAFDVSEPVHVRIIIYDILGREVGRLVDAPYKPGRYRVTFEAGSLSSGMYVYRLTAGRSAIVRRMILVK